MNILVTGIRGFVGTNLVKYFANNGDVKFFGFSRNANNLPEEISKNIEACFSDISVELLKEKRIDAIIHLAGLAHDLDGNNNEADYFRVNSDFTIDVYQKYLASPCSKFIFLSSVKAVTDICTEVLTEEFVPSPKTPYGRSKLKAEDFIRSNSSEGKQNYILRPCMIYGEGNKGNLNLLYKLIKSGLPYPLGAFKNKRSFLSVNNLSFSIDRLLNEGVPSDTFNIADDASLSTTDLVRLIAKAINKRARVLNLPKGFIRLVANIGSYLHLPLNNHSLDKLTENYVVSNEKIKKQLQIEMPFHSQEEIVKTIKSFK